MFEGFAEKTQSDIQPGKLKKVPFYCHISTDQVQRYQHYIDRALKLSPTLEFGENDPRLHRLLVEAVNRDSLSELDLELMRLQYVYADKHLRTRHRSCWVQRVINRKSNDFFPDPWAIVSAVFAQSKPGVCVHNEVGSKARVLT
jgi:hypothetical protein